MTQTMKFDQSRSQAENMIKAFIETRKGHLLNARMVTRDLREFWGVVADWHDVSSVLDYMRSIECVEAHGAGYDGLINYFVK